MADAGIVRNRLKIEGAVLSARAYLEMMEKGPGFSAFLWDFLDGKPKVNTFRDTKQVPAETPLSQKMSKELAARGFKFVGPTIVYAFMQAVGMVNDHLVKCHCHEPRARTHGQTQIESAVSTRSDPIRALLRDIVVRASLASSPSSLSAGEPMAVRPSRAGIRPFACEPSVYGVRRHDHRHCEV